MYFFQENDLPRSIMPIFWFVSNTFIITSRFLLKGMMYSWDTRVNERKQTIVYGAGSAGVQLVESLKKSIDMLPSHLLMMKSKNRVLLLILFRYFHLKS